MGEEIHDAIMRKRADQNVLWRGVDGRDKNVINDLHAGQLYTPRISRYLTDPRLVIPAAQLIGPEVALHHIKAIDKPGTNGEIRGGHFPMHQDWPFLPHEDDRVLAALLACSPGNELTGGLNVYPGSHKQGYLYHEQEPDPDNPSRPFDHLRTDIWPPENAMLVETEPGDIVYFNVFTVHGSGINTSPEPRINNIAQLKNPNNKIVEVDGRNPHPSHAQEMLLCDARDLQTWGVPLNK
jgi:phytanoyl-CoA hydroxylase